MGIAISMATKKVIILLIILIQICTSPILTHCDDELIIPVEWVNKIYGRNIENGGSQTLDGGFIFATYSPIYLQKTDKYGNLQWSKPQGNKNSKAFNVQQTNDGGFIIVGSANLLVSVDQPNEQFLVIKTDKNGEEEWTQTYGGPLDDVGRFIQKTNDNGYIIVGYSEITQDERDLSILKIDVAGNQQWIKYYNANRSTSYQGQLLNQGFVIKQTSDEGYIAVGNTYVGSGGMVVFLVKTDPEGNLVWKKPYNMFEYSNGWDVIESPRDHYVVVGSITNSTGWQHNDMLIMSVDNDGILTWNNTIGYKDKWHEGYRIITTSDGGFLVAGFTFDSKIIPGEKIDYDIYVVKTDSTGNKLWDGKIIDNLVNNEARSLFELSDENYIVTTRNLEEGHDYSTSIIKFTEPVEPNRHTSIIIDELDVSSRRCDVDSTQSIKLHAKWENESSVSNGMIYVNGKEYKTNSDGLIYINIRSPEVQKISWKVTAVNCSGVTDFTQIIASPSIVWDRVNVTLTITNSRIDIGSDADLKYEAVYEYDGNPFQGKANISGLTKSQNIMKSNFTCESIQDNKYGLTVFKSNQVCCVWDRVKITQGGASNSLTKPGSMESVWFKAVYESSGEEFTGEVTSDGGINKIFANGIPMTWSSFDRVWKYSTKLDDNGKLTFEVTGVEDTQYKLTKFVDAAGSQSITWEKPFLETPVGMVSVAAVLAIIIAGVILFHRTHHHQ
jgi:hypothetical protein